MISDNNIRVERIDDETRFQALRDDWNTLATQASRDSVFLRHEWFDAAWEWCRADSAMEILCVWRGVELVGICPFVSRRKRRRGLTIKVIEFLGVPDNQLCDVLAASSDIGQVIEAAIAYVRDDCDMLVLESIPAESPTCQILDSYLTRHDVCGIQMPKQANPCINLTSGWKNFYASRSRRLKKANNWVANRLERAGKKITLKWFRAGHFPRAEIDQALEEAIRLSACSWKRDTGFTLDRAGPHAFFRRLAHHSLNQGWLSLWMLSLDDKPVAAELQMIYEGNVHALRSDFDCAYNDLSVGSYLNWKQLEQLFDSHLNRYWMGPGDNPYKNHWAEDAVELHSYAFYGSSWRSRWLILCDLWLRPVVLKFAGKLLRK